ncbi:hypothetical protein HMPREF9371_1680 [Neisseria shayeganii 871]|uniref:Uncharacterized protein n=1 Tax=Neisseria shayeganii 871 TaxID=1032488 RepID=G4CJ91_9NEIS|nr:hypothetical protein HMPREF9371_1680 [Neisseria shayeganii 871]
MAVFSYFLSCLEYCVSVSGYLKPRESNGCRGQTAIHIFTNRCV